MLLTLLALLTLTSFNGCSKECKPKIEYVDREVEVYIPQRCIVEKVDCQPTGTLSEKVVIMGECILTFIKKAKVCQ